MTISGRATATEPSKADVAIAARNQPFSRIETEILPSGYRPCPETLQSSSFSQCRGSCCVVSARDGQFFWLGAPGSYGLDEGVEHLDAQLADVRAARHERAIDLNRQLRHV